MKEIKLSRKMTLVRAAFEANLIPETTEVIEKTEDGVILKGQNAGNFKTVCVKVIFQEKENQNGWVETHNDVGTGR